MESLLLSATNDTPNLSLNYTNGEIEISAASYPENAIRFYSPVIDWFIQYLESPKEKTLVTFHFTYISSSSVKQIMKIILLLDKLAKTSQVNVLWKYDLGDVEMKQTGERLENLAELKFNYSEV